MKTKYLDKMEFHLEEWHLAIERECKKTAEYHYEEYKKFKALHDELSKECGE